jgi:hypothetical protein
MAQVPGQDLNSPAGQDVEGIINLAKELAKAQKLCRSGKGKRLGKLTDKAVQAWVGPKPSSLFRQ